VALNRVLILAAVVIAFLGVGGYIVWQNIGGGGRPVTINLAVSGTTMTPSDPSAKQGDKVTITVTADKAEEIHLHGYDIHFEVPSAGGSVTHTFTADKSGTFPMEIEQTSTEVGNFKVSP
jgi:FtsP/CotA-like multicopper oxidase with cupredoxin domain